MVPGDIFRRSPCHSLRTVPRPRCKEGHHSPHGDPPPPHGDRLPPSPVGSGMGLLRTPGAPTGANYNPRHRPQHRAAAPYWLTFYFGHAPNPVSTNSAAGAGARLLPAGAL